MTATSPTRMRREIDEIPEAVERLLTHGARDIARAVDRARESEIRYFVSVARGSSDHACTYLKYAAELLLGLPMTSVGPSVASVYGARLQVAGALALAVSQSGQSPDIVRLTRSLREGGARTIAITNNPASPLADAADATLPVQAGPELSVAATKTFVTSGVAGLWFLAELAADGAVLAAIRSLPEALGRATGCDWGPVADAIGEGSLFTLGRGPSWAIANEAALKFKETCRLHAESYSSAEVLHGPVSIIDEGFPVLAFAAADAAEPALAEVADTLAKKGARAFATSDLVTRAFRLDHVRTAHWLTDPLAQIVSFYAMVEEVARRRGIDPDTPRHLRKVTETI